MSGSEPQLTGSQLRAVRAQMLLDQMALIGVELIVLRNGGVLAGQVTFHDYLPTVPRSALEGSLGV